MSSDAMILITVNDVINLLTISKPTLRRYVKDNPSFPKPVQIGKRRIAFKKCDVEAYINSKQRG